MKTRVSVKGTIRNLFIRAIVAIVISVILYGVQSDDVHAAAYVRNDGDALLTEIRREAEEILAKIPAGATDRDKVRLFHDELCRRVRFDTDYDGQYIRDMYGALVEGSAVGEGYAEAFQYLCDRAGVPCKIIYSRNHAWNFVALNGRWAYFIDVSWDDTDRYDVYGREYIAYDCFLVGMKDIMANGPEHIALPEYNYDCDRLDPEVGFWERNGYKMSYFSYDGVYQAFKTQYGLGRTVLQVRYDNAEAFWEACNALTQNDMEMIWDILYGIGQADHYEYIRWEYNDATCTFRVFLDC